MPKPEEASPRHSTMSVRCRHCGTVHQVPTYDRNEIVQCPACKEPIGAICCKPPVGSREWLNSSTIIFVVSVGLVMLFAVNAYYPLWTPDLGDSSDKKTKYPLEYQLAVINKGGYVPSDDSTVVRFAYLLDSLEQKTRNSKQEIADISVVAVEALRDRYGVEVKLMDFMEGMNKGVPAGTEVNYAALPPCICNC